MVEGSKQSTCILMFKSSLSENAKKRLNILKSSTDGFVISEEDMKLRGFGDILGFKQSGIKILSLQILSIIVIYLNLQNKENKFMEKNNIKLNKYKTLMKLYDQADVINDII